MFWRRKAKPKAQEPVVLQAEVMKRRHDEAIQTAVATVPQGSLHIAMSYVAQAAKLFFDNTTRREWVVRQLQEAGFPELVSRLLVELAVTALKRAGDI